MENKTQKRTLRSLGLCLLWLLILGAPAKAITWPLTSDWYGLDFKRANGGLGTGAGLFVFDQIYNVPGCPNGRQYFYTAHNDDGWVQNSAVARLCNPQDQPGGFTRYTLKMMDGPTCTLDVYGAASGPQGGPAGYRIEWFNCSNGNVQSGAYLGGAALRASNSRTASQPGLECLSGAPGLGIAACTPSATGLQLARCVRDCAQRRFLGTGVLGSAPTNCRSHKWSNAVPGVVNPALCVTNVKDQDRDHLIDQIEEDLAHRHAPLEMLTEPEDSENFPSSVEWYLRFASMVYFHASAHPTVHPVQSTVRNDNSAFGIANQSHPSSASDTGPLSYSNRPTSGGRFHVTGCTSSTCKKGVLASNPWEVRTDWKIYANAYPGSDAYGTGILIQYWVFYPYNDTNSGVADHEGDWEHMVGKVRVDTSVPPGGYNGGQQYVAQGGYFKQHEDPYQWRFAQNLQWEPPTGPYLHPKVWVSEGSHASFPDQQSCQGGGWGGTDNCHTTSNNTRWYTWLGGTGGDCGYKGDCQGAGVFLMSTDTANPTALSPQHWAAFSGHWGGQSGSFVGNPTGPAYKSTYNSYKAAIYPLLPIWYPGF
ncbi:MAG TPA: hypothetical protein VN493_13130 [Thermoanaerobaculia bacterium]|nr:hypothetical protein [Thermoanaerobaculia bacterium]